MTSLEGSPNLNPVETKVNRNLKKDICTNHNYGTEERWERK
jgi:predicted transglutaminase-like cysteine proteinase